MQIQRCWAIAQFELNRLFLTKRGLLAVTAFFMFWYFILKELVARGAGILQSDMFREMVETAFGQFGLSSLSEWPMAELVVFWLIAIFLYPMLSLVISADQTASDRERGTLRFLTLRSSRTEILLGRFLGQLLILSVLIGLSLLATIIMGVYNQSATILVGGQLGLNLWFHLTLAILPFIALMTVFNSFLRSARQSLLVASLVLGFGSLLINFAASYVPQLEVLNYVIPGNELTSLMSEPGKSVQGYVQPLLQTCGLLLLSWTINQRSSL